MTNATRITLALCAAHLVLALGGCATEPANLPAPAQPAEASPAPAAAQRTEAAANAATPASPVPKDVAQEDLGIRVRSIRLSAAGHMLDFRYRVVDAEKAVPLLTRRLKPLLVDEASGAKLGVPSTPKLGQLRTTDGGRGARVDRDLHMLFANPGKIVQPGARVGLILGDVKLANLQVE